MLKTLTKLGIAFIILTGAIIFSLVAWLLYRAFDSSDGLKFVDSDTSGRPKTVEVVLRTEKTTTEPANSTFPSTPLGGIEKIGLIRNDQSVCLNHQANIPEDVVVVQAEWPKPALWRGWGIDFNLPKRIDEVKQNLPPQWRHLEWLMACSLSEKSEIGEMYARTDLTIDSNRSKGFGAGLAHVMGNLTLRGSNEASFGNLSVDKNLTLDKNAKMGSGNVNVGGNLITQSGASMESGNVDVGGDLIMQSGANMDSGRVDIKGIAILPPSAEIHSGYMSSRGIFRK